MQHEELFYQYNDLTITPKEKKSIKDKLVLLNLGLVRNTIKYYGQSNNEDLLHEGVIGLMRAIEKFNPELGFQFSTYALWWIKQAINKYVQAQKLVRLPAHANNLYKKINKNFSSDDGPTKEELQLLLKTSKVIIDATMNNTGGVISINQAMFDNEETFDIPDNNEFNNAENVLQMKEALKMAFDTINKLPLREQQILKMRYGLCEDNESFDICEDDIINGIIE